MVLILRVFKRIALYGCLFIGLSVHASSEPLSFSGKAFSLYQTLKPASLLIGGPEGSRLYSDNIFQPMVPASTTKLITAFLALKHWGADYRFHTDFTLISSPDSIKPVLKINAYGDPFLVSEEVKIIAVELAKRLKEKGIQRLSYLQLENHWFEPKIRLPGTGESLNPYDAINGAFAVNFNSINLLKTSQGWASAEEQTPFTPTAAKIAEASGLKLKTGRSERINIGKDIKLNRQYAAEILLAFLHQEGIEVENSQLQMVSAVNRLRDSIIFSYRHFNSRTLAEVIRPMMKYSTNFIANQIALNLSAERYGAPASKVKLQKFYAGQLKQYFGWSDDQVHFMDGAGLSRQNRISAEQLMQVLRAFKRWRHLLPEVEKGVYAKSGSLIGVSTLAGYFHHQQQWLPFVFLSNQRVPYHFRNRLARSLKSQLPINLGLAK